jgi:hypothetical protein
MFTINWFFTESYTSKPLAGLLMEVIEAVLILGMSIPFAGLDISIWADASGTVVPTPTLWQKMNDGKTKETNRRME